MQLKVLLFVAHSPPSLTLSASLSLIHWKSLSETKTIQQKTPIFINYFLQLSYFINWGSFFTLKTDFFGSGAKKTSDSWDLRKPCEHSPTGSQEWLTSAWQLHKRQSQEPISSHHKPAGHIPHIPLSKGGEFWDFIWTRAWDRGVPYIGFTNRAGSPSSVTHTAHATLKSLSSNEWLIY